MQLFASREKSKEQNNINNEEQHYRLDGRSVFAHPIMPHHWNASVNVTIVNLFIHSWHTKATQISNVEQSVSLPIRLVWSHSIRMVRFDCDTQMKTLFLSALPHEICILFGSPFCRPPICAFECVRLTGRLFFSNGAASPPAARTATPL